MQSWRGREYVEDRSGEGAVWTAGFSCCWTKMEAAAQDRSAWRQIVNGVAYGPLGATRHKSSKSNLFWRLSKATGA